MQKVVDFLEKYCQWLAVGIAALFFLLAIWQFLPGLSTPVHADDPSGSLGPGEVDPHILETAALPLDAKIKAGDRIKDNVPPYGQQFIQKSQEPPKVSPLPANVIEARVYPLPDAMVPPSPESIGNDSIQEAQGPKELPKLPVATIEAPTTGFAQVTPPGAPGAAPAAVPVQPIINVAGGGAAAAPNPNAKDVTWVRVPFIISTRQIQQSFQTVGIPPQMMQTNLVRVELIRQRELPGSAWDAEEVVKSLDINTQLRSVPSAGSQVNVLLEFMRWAEQNQQLIAQPPFFTIVGGENPNVTKPAEVVQVDIFDPATFPRNGDLSKLTPEQRKQVLDHRKANPITPVRQPQRAGPTGVEGGEGPPSGSRGPRGPRGGRGGRGGGEPRIAPAAPLQPGQVVELQYRPNMPPPGMGGMGVGDEAGMYPGMNGETPGAPAVGQPITLPAVPPGPWDLRQAGAGLADVYGVAYDTDARGDSSYRYRIRYSVVNPLFNTRGIAQNPNLEKVFEIVGEDKEKWSEPIEIAPRSYVFLAAPPQPSATNVRFTIYHWQDGRQHKIVQSVSNGDSIGKPDNNIDFRTPWTFVEVRRDPATNNVYALLMNSEGKLRRSIFQVDKDSPQQKKLSDQVEAANVAAGQAAAVPPGAPGRPPGANATGVAE